MSNNYLKKIKEFYGDDVYINDPILKINDLKNSESEASTEATVVNNNKSITQADKNTNAIDIQPLNSDQGNELKAGTAKVQNQQSNSIDITTINDMATLDNTIKNCQKCGLCENRNSFVFGKGNSGADIMVIGEAPGAEEDRQGIPFVGRAGQLLDKILAAVELDLDKVFITNIVKCRPPENRDPEKNEIAACNDYLLKQISLLKPKLILALGRVSGRTLLGQELSLSKMRGSFHSYQGIPMMITYHPSALLRNEAWKRPTWEDMKLFKQKYNELIGQG